MHVAIIGSGVMGSLFARAWAKANLASPEYLIVVDPDTEKSRLLKAELNCKCLTEPSAALSETELVLLAVKPQEAISACKSLDQFLPKKSVVISLMAGVQTATLKGLLPGREIIRCMPNTPARIGLGMTVFFRGTNSRFDPAPFFEALGKSMQVSEENLIDAATAVSASGPAYFYYFFEHMISAAVQLGFSPEQAKLLISATAVGAASLWDSGSATPEELRAAVTSKGGTTAAAIDIFESQKIGPAIVEALLAAFNRARQLSGKN